MTAFKLNSVIVTDAAGNVANLAGAVTNPVGTLRIGTPTAPTTVIPTHGSTSVIKVGTPYYLHGSSGSGPALKYNGANVTTREFGAWTPIGAIQTASGYDVAGKNTSTGRYMVWSTDSNGNYKRFDRRRRIGISSALVAGACFPARPNRDGVIGLYAAPGTTRQITNVLAGTTGSATIGKGATLEVARAESLP